MKSKQRKIKEYSKIIGKDEDFDYGFLLDLEQFKLKRMLKYWKLYSHLENGHIIIGYLKTCINLIDIINERDCNIDYVNIKNSKRFVNYDINNSKEALKTILLGYIRIKKALYLYNKIRAYTMLYWWD